MPRPMEWRPPSSFGWRTTRLPNTRRSCCTGCAGNRQRFRHRHEPGEQVPPCRHLFGPSEKSKKSDRAWATAGGLLDLAAQKTHHTAVLDLSLPMPTPVAKRSSRGRQEVVKRSSRGRQEVVRRGEWFSCKAASPSWYGGTEAFPDPHSPALLIEEPPGRLRVVSESPPDFWIVIYQKAGSGAGSVGPSRGRGC